MTISQIYPKFIPNFFKRLEKQINESISIQIRIFDDRLEIWNPGCLPPGLTIERLKIKHDSVPRNPLISIVFQTIKEKIELTD